LVEPILELKELCKIWGETPTRKQSWHCAFGFHRSVYYRQTGAVVELLKAGVSPAEVGTFGQTELWRFCHDCHGVWQHEEPKHPGASYWYPFGYLPEGMEIPTESDWAGKAEHPL